MQSFALLTIFASIMSTPMNPELIAEIAVDDAKNVENAAISYISSSSESSLASQNSVAREAASHSVLAIPEIIQIIDKAEIEALLKKVEDEFLSTVDVARDADEFMTEKEANLLDKYLESGNDEIGSYQKDRIQVIFNANFYNDIWSINNINAHPDLEKQELAHVPFVKNIEILRLKNLGNSKAPSAWIKTYGLTPLAEAGNDDKLELLALQSDIRLDTLLEVPILRASAMYPGNDVLRAARYNILRRNAPGLEMSYGGGNEAVIASKRLALKHDKSWDSLKQYGSGLEKIKAVDSIMETILPTVPVEWLRNPKQFFNHDEAKVITKYLNLPENEYLAVGAFNILRVKEQNNLAASIAKARNDL